jgi:radical SAM protein with 4Fe4S-binding SPASM domain
MGSPTDVTVETTDNALVARDACGAYLASRPVEHNMALTILERRVARPAPGRWWWARLDGEVVGLAWHSPATMKVGLAPVTDAVAFALAETVHADEPHVPGVIGKAASAAAFAGRWTELSAQGAVPVEGERLYELTEIMHTTDPLVAPPEMKLAATKEMLDYGLSVAEQNGAAVSVQMETSVAQVRNRFRDAPYFANNKCFYPWSATRMNPYGDIYNCSLQNLMGNVREQPLDVIWNGPRYTAFRQDLRTCGLYPQCQRCCALNPHDLLGRLLPRFSRLAAPSPQFDPLATPDAN